MSNTDPLKNPAGAPEANKGPDKGPDNDKGALDSTNAKSEEPTKVKGKAYEGHAQGKGEVLCKVLTGRFSKPLPDGTTLRVPKDEHVYVNKAFADRSDFLEQV